MPEQNRVARYFAENDQARRQLARAARTIRQTTRLLESALAGAPVEAVVGVGGELVNTAMRLAWLAKRAAADVGQLAGDDPRDQAADAATEVAVAAMRLADQAVRSPDFLAAHVLAALRECAAGIGQALDCRRRPADDAAARDQAGRQGEGEN